MQLILNEEQAALAKTATDFARKRSPVARMRALRDSRDEIGFSKELWKEMAELGWTAVHIPEEHGGIGLGFFELSLILEAAGRTLMPEPFTSTLLLGANLLIASDDAHSARWLPEVCTGDALLALAWDERGARNRANRCATRAVAVDGGFRISGCKESVLDAHTADRIFVSARTGGQDSDPDGITVFSVDPAAAGLTIERQTRIDHRNCARVLFEDVRVSTDDVVGTLDSGLSLLEGTLDRATAGTAAELFGTTDEAFEIAVAYLKERKQFGVPIGSFQALQHRASRLFIELKLAESAVIAAAKAVDDAPDNVPAQVSLAKARISDAAIHVCNEAVQFHGGVGITDEYDIGLYLKRARVAELSFGDAAHHRDRWATLKGY